MGGVVDLEDCYGVLEGVCEVQLCDVVVYAAGPSLFVVCDGMCECGVILGSQVEWPISLKDGLLKLFYTLIVFVCAPNASLYTCFRAHVFFLVLSVPLVW